MRKVGKVGVSELSDIQPGETVVFVLPTGASRASGAVQAYKMPILNPRDGIVRYSCKCLPPTEYGYPLEVKAVTDDNE